MPRSIVVCICLLCWMNSASSQEGYARYFGETTLRMDYYHSGAKGQESFSYDQAIEEGAWPGSRRNLIDTLNLGEYLVRVYDRGTGQLIYSRGFSSMFQEWQTTDEAARGMFRTFSESVRFPFPRHVVQVTIARRDRYLVFHELFSAVVDPSDPTQVSREKGMSAGKILPIIDNGPPATKVDILILGDGYSAAEMDKFQKDARHFTEVMFQTPPFDKRKKDFNVRALEVGSSESGIDVPDKGVWKATALGCSYNTFGSARYVLTTENKRLREIAGSAPYDFLCILVNDTRYGGGGIFQLYATTYTKESVHGQEWQMDYVYVHEFGHSFGGLGDEYYTSTTAYNDMYPAGVEPWEPNITSLGDPKNLKWKLLVTAGVAIPTPWQKAQYDSIEAVRGKMDRLAPDYYEKREPLYRAEQKLLHESPQAGKVGAFEGAGYATKGLFRPAVDCRMFSLSTGGFDPVCGAAIERMIDFYSR